MIRQQKNHTASFQIELNSHKRADNFGLVTLSAASFQSIRARLARYIWRTIRLGLGVGVGAGDRGSGWPFCLIMTYLNDGIVSDGIKCPDLSK